MTEEELQQILKRYSEGKATEQEKALLESWYLNYNSDHSEQAQMPELLEAVDRVWANVNPMPVVARQLSLFAKLSIAAAVLLILSFGTWFILQKQEPAVFELSVAKDIAPGQNKATLTLASGRKIILAETAVGEILREPGGLSISHTKSGELIYTSKATGKQTAGAAWNTLETFKGEQHQLMLPDGSHVWLNAASSITFPDSFSATREVSVSGEVYFEVAHDPSRPFIVKSKGQRVEVLGTHFNINVYPDEPSGKTTLLEGAVRISTDANGSSLLKPGEQASLTAGKIRVAKVSTDEVIAWKNGYFMFESEDIRSVMRKISRWYNVEVVYEGEVPQDTFGGTIDRFAKVSQVLKKLQLTDKVHFKVEGRRIIVTK